MGAAVSVADEDSVSAVRDRLPSTADAMAGLHRPHDRAYCLVRLGAAELRRQARSAATRAV